MSDDLTKEMCSNCILWDGDSTGYQGMCNESIPAVLTCRGDDCIHFLARTIGGDAFDFN